MMDAVEYIKEKQRMCDTFNDEGSCRCCRCEFSKSGIDCTEPEDPEEAVRIVEEWSKAHPIQTNADKLQEVFSIPKREYKYYLPFSGEREIDEGEVVIGLTRKWLEAPYEAPKGAEHDF